MGLPSRIGHFSVEESCYSLELHRQCEVSGRKCHLRYLSDYNSVTVHVGVMVSSKEHVIALKKKKDHCMAFCVPLWGINKCILSESNNRASSEIVFLFSELYKINCFF